MITRNKRNTGQRLPRHRHDPTLTGVEQTTSDAHTLTSSRLSKLAFRKEEVTELASFSAIQALKSLTANEAAMPVKGKRECHSRVQRPLVRLYKATVPTRFPETANS